MDTTPADREATPAPDRRRSPRVTVELPARVVGDGWTRSAHTVDLSEDGVLVSGNDFPAGERVRLEIELAELGWRSMEATVVRRTDASGDERLAACFARAATEGGRTAIRDFFESRLGLQQAA